MKNGDMPAMPIDTSYGFTLGKHCPNGLTKREYFAAHAPHEPQPWFIPDFPEPPKPPALPALTQARREYFLEFHDVLKPDKAETADEREYLLEFQKYRKDMAEWNMGRTKAVYTQWPIAYADALLAELEKDQ